MEVRVPHDRATSSSDYLLGGVNEMTDPLGRLQDGIALRPWWATLYRHDVN